MSEESTPKYVDLYREVIPSVVSVYTDGADPRRPSGAGSGFVYDDAHVVTNSHVVRGTTTVEIRFADGEWHTGEVAGLDEYTDLATIRVPELPGGADPLPVAPESPPPGSPVAALGNPMGLDGTISTGVVSGVNRSMPVRDGQFAIPDTVQTDAPINPGNSGGPLVTDDGVVVGVNRARQGDNIGFAVSPALVRRVVPDLIGRGHAAHATLHVSTIDVSPAVAAANDVDPGGVLVVNVRPGPASGVLGGCHGTTTVDGRTVPVGGDVLVGIAGVENGTAVDHRPMRSHEELTRYLMAECRPGDRVELTVRRPAGETTERVVLADRDRPTSSDAVRVEG